MIGRWEIIILYYVGQYNPKQKQIKLVTREQYEDVTKLCRFNKSTE